MDKYRYWDILDTIPDGWVIDKTAGAPAPNTVFITNGKSVLNGQKRALLKVAAKKENAPLKFETFKPTVKKAEQVAYVFPARTVQILARKQMEERLLQDIRTDLVICELEGWDKKEYIAELQCLINSFEL